jgi:transketolase
MKQANIINTLNQRSAWLRKELFTMAMRYKRGHIPSCYSCVELITTLYYGDLLHFDPKNPSWSDRDRLIVSKGHAAMVIYPILADLGFIPKEELAKFCQVDGLLRMYADPSIPGVETVTGSLGHGLGIGAGFALSGKRAGKTYRNFVVLGDGECYEGSIWETAMFASHYELDNLVAIVDRNNLCIMAPTEECIRINPLEDKWESFGWYTQSIDGHSHQEILSAFKNIDTKAQKRPAVIIANTVKGKGISFMEGKADWHNKMPTPEQIAEVSELLKNNCSAG